MMRPRYRLLVALALVASALAPAPAHAAKTKAKDPDCLRRLGSVDLQTDPIVDLQRALDTGKITSVRLVRRYLDRIKAFDGSGPALNSIREIDPDALDLAAKLDAERDASGPRGPLHGIPVLLKDNVGTVNLPTTAGSIALKGSVPLDDAFLTAQLRDAGAIILGKTNLSEFANWVDLSMPNGYSSLGGQVIAPYDPSLDPSGSSTGSGVAGTMALAAATIGTETSGSIISPATRHSLVGVKPTLGLVSRSGVIPLAPSFDTAGPMVRTVTDAAIMLGAIAGVDPEDPATEPQEGNTPKGRNYLRSLKRNALEGVRLGVREGDLSNTSGTGALFQDAIAGMEAAGATIVPIDSEVSPLASASTLELAAIFNEFKYSLNIYLETETEPTLRVRTLSEIIEYNEQHPDKVKYGQSLLQLSDAQSGSPFDPVYLASKTAAITASKTWIDTVLTYYDVAAIVAPDGGNTGVTAAAGYPNVTVPMGYTATTPHGIAFAGTAWSEPELLGFAYATEQLRDNRVPPPN
ncbi:MAG: amidase family protein, partial [Actinomycetota bacterium]